MAVIDRVDDRAGQPCKPRLVRSKSLGDEKLRLWFGRDSLHGTLAGTGYLRNRVRGLPRNYTVRD